MTTDEEIQWMKKEFERRINDLNIKDSSELDLSNFNQYKLGKEDLPELMKQITKEFTSLNLSFNYLCMLGFEEVIFLLKNLPKSVTSLNLQRTQLGELSFKKLKHLLESLPPNVTSLNLSYNCLCRLGDIQLKKFLANIPQSVTALDLSNNSFSDYFPGAHSLAEALAEIPINVTSVNLSNNSLFTKMNHEEFDMFLNKLGSTRNRFNLSGNESEMNQKKINAIKKLCDDYKAHLQLSLTSQHADKKKEIMQQLEGILSDKNYLIPEKLSKIAKCLDSNKATLQEHRDSIWTRFIASILHVLSLGMYSKFTKGTFAFWKSHGEVLLNNLEEHIKPDSSNN